MDKLLTEEQEEQENEKIEAVTAVAASVKIQAEEEMRGQSKGRG